MMYLAEILSNISVVNYKQMAVSSTVLLPILEAEAANVIEETIKYILNMTVSPKGIKMAWR
jgi:hypothetical protein